MQMAQEIKRVGQAVGILVRDPERTEEIMIAEQILCRRHVRRLLDEGVFDTEEGRALLRDRPNLRDADLDALRALPEGTLGRETVRFVEDNGLTWGLYDLPMEWVEDPEVAWVLGRYQTSHDLIHAVLGLGVSEPEELVLHGFMLAQTGFPVSLALVAIGGLQHILLKPRNWHHVALMRRAWREGRRAANVVGVYWERYWETPLPELRARLRVEPIPVG